MICKKCGEERSEADFSSKMKRGYCKPCVNAYNREYYQANKDKYNQDRDPVKKAAQDRRYKYGISDEQYEALLAQQDGRCAICQEPCISGRRLSVDHCHRTGTVRGLLCTRCNPGLGFFQDDVELLEKAITYLRGDTK